MIAGVLIGGALAAGALILLGSRERPPAPKPIPVRAEDRKPPEPR